MARNEDALHSAAYCHRLNRDLTSENEAIQTLWAQSRDHGPDAPCQSGLRWGVTKRDTADTSARRSLSSAVLRTPGVGLRAPAETSFTIQASWMGSCRSIFHFSSRRPASPSARGGWGRAWIFGGVLIQGVADLGFAVCGVAVLGVAALGSPSVVVAVRGVAVHTATCRERRTRSAEDIVLHHPPVSQNRPHGPCAHGEAGLWLRDSVLHTPRPHPPRADR